jgi:stage II sporulation protein AB (anti-sigma F factor)
MKVTNYIKIEFPSRSANEALSRNVAACFAAQLDPTLEELGDIKTAVSEAVTNCIIHAYPHDIGRICMKCKLIEDRCIEISIRDWGKGITDVGKAMEPLFTTGGDDRSGMGFSIMESFMDYLKVRSQENKGTTVKMRKKIAQKNLD